MSRAIFALTLAAFGIGTSEYVIMGLLPDVAENLSVTIPQAGLLVSAYAMGVVIGAPVLTLLTAGFPRRGTLLGLVGMFILGNLLCAVSGSYAMLLATRILTALCHGTYFGIASVVAIGLAPANRKTQAVALVFMGVSLANVLGVPFGTLIGHYLGWRSTFYAVSAIGIAALAALTTLVPGNIPMYAVRALDEIRELGRPAVFLTLSLSVATSASLFVVFAYITPLLEEVSGIAPARVAWVLFLLGFGLSIGSLLGGRLGDRSLLKSLLLLILATTGVLVLMRFSIASGLLTAGVLFLWGIAAFAICPLLQTLVVNHASGAPNLASSFNQSAFNLGNALGAWIGAVLLSAGMALRELPVAAAGVMIVPLALFFLLCRFQTPRLRRK